MIRVLFLINSLGGGGTERVLVNLANNMDYEKFEVSIRTIVDCGPNKAFLSEKIWYDYLFRKPFRGLNLLDRVPGIYRYATHGEYDVIIAYLHGVCTRILAKAPAEQHTIAFLHANMKESPFMKDLIRRGKAQSCFRSFDRIVAVSESVRQTFIETTGITENTCVKYNTFDVPLILKSAKKQDYNLLKQNGRICLCSVGKLEQVKGFDRMIRVLARLKDMGILYTWNVVGGGADRAKLEKMVREYGLTDLVRFCGFDPNPYKYIANSDLFVCSSYSEGFSSVVAESIILGVPVLTTDCSGMKEMLGDHNEYGIVVNNDEDSLYDMLKRISQSDTILPAYREKVKHRADFFSITRTVREVEKMIDEVLE